MGVATPRTFPRMLSTFLSLLSIFHFSRIFSGLLTSWPRVPFSVADTSCLEFSKDHQILDPWIISEFLTLRISQDASCKRLQPSTFEISAGLRVATEKLRQQGFRDLAVVSRLIF